MSQMQQINEADASKMHRADASKHGHGLPQLGLRTSHVQPGSKKHDALYADK